ncbi:disease resistance protein RPV1-like isoform X2 [Gastrolobium bilobum]|uniref:disease resistance protein RPV1-like isoform X2 n=1 Tax=Gastrolobium bilobum TaxID=150636 RepID=UPI002AB0AEE2|nr:disease resistance protein RPV1-like isoform X2 [Gastrolobium bilobum]
MNDVFLSFRGEDTRTNFISHLYKALYKKPVNAFIDDNLRRGEDVWPALSKAIEESHISVVVFSENYASSKWCLEELVKILECRKDHGQVVMPVFYETDPSDIRKQAGTYETAFAKHERDLRVEDSESNKQKVLKWRVALSEAANISGWDSRNHKDPFQFIHNIVEDVWQKLSLMYPNELKGLVEIDENSKSIESLLHNVPRIGIWGMGGIGKTTIARDMFAKHFPQYDSACFLANVREETKKPGGLEYTRNKLLSELLKEPITTSHVTGSTFIKRRLSSKKVFIVLDDVDSSDQLEYLCRDLDDLGPDSRLIITTRNRHLLCGSVNEIYEVTIWKFPESMKLFCLKAFGQNHPLKGYEHLSVRAVEYARGLPLALEVLGSYLRSKSIRSWESTLREFKKYPDEKIQNLLKVSYDGLDGLEKMIFQDIAFFFIGEKKDHVIRILDACGFEASSRIEVLEDKALITISNSDRIQMHDLLQKMALEILREDRSRNPARRSQLWDAREVIEQNKSTDIIQGIILDLSEFLLSRSVCESLYEDHHSVLSANTLNTLKLYVVWTGYPCKSLPPPPFYALVEIRMPHSNVKQLWQGIQEFGNLKGIDLSECKLLVKLPDLSKESRLKWMNLSGCESLCDLHDTVLSANTLSTLILDRCINLESVNGKKNLKSLVKISVNDCLSLKEFAVSSNLIENLDLSNTGIQRLDTSIGLLQNLKWLNVEGLRLTHLPKELSCLKSLKVLKLSYKGPSIDKKQLNSLFDGLRSLQILYLKDCSNLFELPDNIRVLSQLQELRLDGSNVIRLPASIMHLSELEILSLENCRKLRSLPELPPSIKQLYAINCTSLVSVSNLKTLATKMIGKAKNISFKNSLKLDVHSLKRIVESLHLTMMSAAFHNVLVRRLPVAEHYYNYTSVEVCLPGSTVPRRFKYRTKESSITIELPSRSNLQGFIYSMVLSPAGGMKDGTKLKCQCQLPDTDFSIVTWLNTDITELNSDYVYVWYDPFHCDSILKFYEPKVRFDFCVANNKGEVDGSICIKECGVCLISVSDSQCVLPKLDLDTDKRKALEKGLELETALILSLTSIERSDEKEIKRPSEQSSSDDTIVIEPKSVTVELKSAEEYNGSKYHFSDVKESVGSTHKKTMTGGGSNRPSPTRKRKWLVFGESNSEFRQSQKALGYADKETKTSPGRGCEKNTKESTKAVPASYTTDPSFGQYFNRRNSSTEDQQCNMEEEKNYSDLSFKIQTKCMLLYQSSTSMFQEELLQMSNPRLSSEKTC